jgi:hypothetical protein
LLESGMQLDPGQAGRLTIADAGQNRDFEVRVARQGRLHVQFRPDTQADAGLGAYLTRIAGPSDAPEEIKSSAA